MAEAAGGLLYDVGIGLGLAGGASIPGVEIGTGTGAGAASIPAVPIAPGESTGAVLSGSVLIPGESSGSVLSGSTLIPGEGASDNASFILDIGPGASVGPVFEHEVDTTPLQSFGPSYDHDAQPLIIAVFGPIFDHVAVSFIPAMGPVFDGIFGVVPGSYLMNLTTTTVVVPPRQSQPQTFTSPFVYRNEKSPTR